MIRTDRELLVEMAQLNRDVPALALRIMEDSATAEEQRLFAARLAQLGQRLHGRADETGSAVIEGEVVEKAVALGGVPGGQSASSRVTG